MNQSIRELVLLAKAGNQEAISILYETNYNSVYQSVRALLKDEDATLDIVQDSFIKGFQNLDKLSDPEKFQPWMKTLAANLARDYLRKKKPVLFSERVNEEGEELDLQHPDDCIEHQPEAMLDQKETARLIRNILDTLSEEQRLAVVMCYYEEKTVREIAEASGVSENTIKSRLKYARSKIEKEVKKLEKKGVKLYSLAPLPFFIWLLRTAKKQDVSFVRNGAGAAMAAGIALEKETTTGTASATAAGEASATAASTTSGNAAVSTAVKTAGSAAGKAIATKIVAGTLAATITAGTGAVVIHNINEEKENAENHAVYEEFTGHYEETLETVALEVKEDFPEVVEDIPEVTEIDAFANFDVSFSGISPNVSVLYNDVQEINGATVEYVRVGFDSLKEGDSFTIRALLDDPESFCLKEDRKTFTVSGVDRYITSNDELLPETFDLMKETADALVATKIQEWEGFYHYYGFEFVGYEFWNQKEPRGLGDPNAVYLYYRIDASDESGDFSVYYYVCFDDIVQHADGTQEVDTELPSRLTFGHFLTLKSYSTLEILTNEVHPSYFDALYDITSYF